jgi:hypothetical protein
MYVEAGRELTVKEVTKALDVAMNEHKLQWQYPEHAISAAREIVNLNHALLIDASVYAICEKEPRGNLDTGGHHYSIYYVANNKATRFWAYEAMKLFGCRNNKSHRSLPYWTFFSSAIGMSRLLDATEGLFYFIKKLGGCYAQIQCL